MKKKKSFCIRYEEENLKRWEREHKTLESLTSFTRIRALNSSINSSGSVDHTALGYSLSQTMEIIISRHSLKEKSQALYQKLVGYK